MKSLRLIPFIGAAAILGACSNDFVRTSFPDTYNDHHYWAARQAIDLGEPQRAVQHMELAAQNNSSSAMVWLGHMHLNGKAGSRNLSKAIFWYEQTIHLSQGDMTPIKKRLGDMYARGAGTNVDEQKAHDYWSQVIQDYEQKPLLSARETVTLANMYAHGQGVPKDGKKAISLLNARVHENNPNIARTLGDIYFFGYDIRKDFSKALEWYENAYNLGDNKRLRQVADMYFNAKGTKFDAEKANYFYSEYVAELEKIVSNPNVNVNYIRDLASMYAGGLGVQQADGEKAIELLTRNVGNEGGVNERLIGDIYLNAQGLEKPNIVKAAEWYNKAIELGDAARLATMANLYAKGEGIEKNMDQAQKYWALSIKHLTKLGNERSPSENRRLANMYISGQGTTANIEKALELLTPMTGAGDGFAERLIGDIYFSGTSLPKPDLEKAVFWYEKSLAEGSLTRLERLASMYEQGKGTKKDTIKANKLFKKAAASYEERGVSRADWQTRALARLYANGQGVTKDIQKAISLYESISQHDATAARYGADLAYSIKDIKRARTLYETAFSQGDYARIKRLIDIYSENADQEIETAQKQKIFKKYEEILQQKTDSNPNAAVSLAHYYLNKGVGNDNVAKAIKLLKQAVPNSPSAAILLGDLYYKGDVVKRDFTQALALYKTSYEGGRKTRLARISSMYQRGQGTNIDSELAKKFKDLSKKR